MKDEFFEKLQAQKKETELIKQIESYLLWVYPILFGVDKQGIKEDIVQETLIHINSVIFTISPDSWRAYLNTCMHNVWKDKSPLYRREFYGKRYGTFDQIEHFLEYNNIDYSLLIYDIKQLIMKFEVAPYFSKIEKDLKKKALEFVDGKTEIGGPAAIIARRCIRTIVGSRYSAVTAKRYGGVATF